MSLLLIAVVTLSGILLGKFIFKKWLNHLTLYSLIFGGMTFLYELKLLPYVDIIPLAWFIIFASFLSFILGVLTIISARNLSKENPIFEKKSNISLKIFLDNGKTLKYAIILFSIISVYSTIEFWMILIKQFGSIPAILINGQVIYRLSISGELKGTTPYIFLFGYIAVFFSGIYTAYKKRFTLLIFIPFISVILREIAAAGRAGMLFALMEFTISFLLFRNLLKDDEHQRYKFSKSNAIISSIIVISLFIAASSLVRVSRVTSSSEKFKGASRELSETKENFFISPTVYLYASSSVGVLSKYLSSDGENTGFGHNTFSTFYLLLAKFNIIDRPLAFPKGYYIPMWTNAGTYLRELHADFGILGVFWGPYLLGLLTTWFWFKFYATKSLIVFTILVYFYLIIGFSFSVMSTRFLHWMVNLFLILIMIPFLEKIASLQHN